MRPTYLQAALRGGNWNNGTRTGVFALNLNNAPSNANNNIGLRAAMADAAMAGVERVVARPRVPLTFGDAILATSGYIRLAKHMNRWAGDSSHAASLPARRVEG